MGERDGHMAPPFFHMPTDFFQKKNGPEPVCTWNHALSTCEPQHLHTPYSMNHEICTLDGNPRQTHSSIVGSLFMIQSTCMLSINQ